MILISMLKLMMTSTCDQVSDNIPISPFNNCLIGILPFEMLMLALVISLCADRLSLLLAKERSHPQTYIGCMKKGPVFTDPKLKWYEPQSFLLGSEYFLHAYGPIYALSADVVASLVALRNNSFRMFSNEDVTIGSWMLAMNVNHENTHALCEPDCTESSIAVWDIPKCSGLCHPEVKKLELHQRKECTGGPTVAAEVSESDDR